MKKTNETKKKIVNKNSKKGAVKHAKVLNWVNSQRKNLGLKPLSTLPRGDREMVDSCPIATALSKKNAQVEVDDEVRITMEIPVPKAVREFVRKVDHGGDNFGELAGPTIESTQHIDLPEYVSSFISKFDNGHFPDLENK